MNDSIGMLTEGSRPPEVYSNFFTGPILAFDTSRGVLQLEKSNERIHAVHMELDPYKQIPTSVPKDLLKHGNNAGSALVNTRAYVIHLDNRVIRELIQKFLSSLMLAIIFVSAGGGTGNGAFEPLLDMIRSFKLPTRLIFLHELNSVVNPEKMWCRIRSLRSKGTVNELHLFMKDPETVKSFITSISADDFDILKEVIVNINAKNKEGVIL